MGFLSSPLTESRQAAVQNSFALGLQMADATIRQNQAAANEMKQAQEQQAFQWQMYQKQQADTLAYRRELANERLQMATQKNAADLTERQVTAGIANITKSGDTLMRVYDDIIANKQGMYDPSTVAQADNLIREIQRITALGIQSISGVKPGEKVDITPTLQALGELPKIDYKFDPTYIKTKESEAAAKTAYAGSLTGKNAPEKEPDWIGGYSDALAGYQTAKQSLENRKNNIDAYIKQKAEINGYDPFAPEARAVGAAKIPVSQWASAARRALQNDNSDMGDIYKVLTQQGFDPFDPDNADNVGKTLYKYTRMPQVDDAYRKSIDKFSTIVTGRSTSAFAPLTPIGIGPATYYAPPSPAGSPQVPEGLHIP